MNAAGAYELLAGFDGVSLKDLDERAALLRRVDNKYALDGEAFRVLAGRLRASHEVLDIDGRRVFSYRSTYFETPDLRCFVDHVEDRVPRFKARTRLYEDSGECFFEVKIKRSGDETDKRQLGYAREDRRRLTADAFDCLRSSLKGVGLDPPDDLAAELTTRFDRVTFVAGDAPDRLTCDFGVRLIASDGRTAVMRDGLVLIETKSETGDSPADRALAEIGRGAISLSKYRVGLSAVGRAQRFGAQPGSDLFESSEPT
jgi:hypothetical protein